MRARSGSRSALAKLPVLLWRLARVGTKIETEFRTDFLLATVQFLLYNALFVVFWQAVTGRTQALEPWTTGELVVFTFVAALQAALYIPFLGFNWLPETVREGKLDKYLCRPVDPILLLCFESVYVVAFLRMLIVNLVAIGGCVWYFGLPVTLPRALLSLLLLMMGTLVWACINGTVSLVSFWTGEVGTLSAFVNIGRRFDRYPIDLFPDTVARVLTWFVPVSLIATFPAMVFLGKPVDLAAVFATAAALLLAWGALFRYLSHKALAAYESFGG